MNSRSDFDDAFERQELLSKGSQVGNEMYMSLDEKIEMRLLNNIRKAGGKVVLVNVIVNLCKGHD